MTGVDRLWGHRRWVWTAPGSLSFVPGSPQGLGTARPTEPQLLHTRRPTRRTTGGTTGRTTARPDGRPPTSGVPAGGSGLAGLHLHAVGELADLVEDRSALGEELADLAVG